MVSFSHDCFLTWGSSSIFTSADATSCLHPSTAEPSVKMLRSEPHLLIASSAAACMRTRSLLLLLMPMSSGKMVN